MSSELVYGEAKVISVLHYFVCCRAWVGDSTAAIHVANIVGVAPPDYYQEEDKSYFISLPKVVPPLCIRRLK